MKVLFENKKKCSESGVALQDKLNMAKNKEKSEKDSQVLGRKLEKV